MRHLKTVLSVIGATTVLVLAANTVALATTGQALLLGRSNSANTITALTRTTTGTALKVTTKSSTNAPFAVNGKGKVASLNADLVDGYDSSALRTAAYIYEKEVSSPTASVAITIPVPMGSYVVSYAAYMNGAAGSAVDCYVDEDYNATPGGSMVRAQSSFIAGASTPGVTGTGFVTKWDTGVLTLHCSAGTNWTTPSDQPLQIVATKIDNVHESSIHSRMTQDRTARP